MTATTSTDIADVLKDIYIEPGKILDTIYSESPFLGMITKDFKAGGRKLIVPVNYAAPGGTSNTYATAVSQQASGKYDAFEHAWSNKHTYIAFGDDPIRDCGDSKNALIDVVKNETDAAIAKHTAEVCANLHRSTGGYLGRIASTSTVTTWAVTLSKPSDAMNFVAGDIVNLSANTGDLAAHTLRTGDLTIGAVDYITGTLYTAVSTTHWDDTVTGAAASDYIFKKGSFKTSVAGVGGWVPFVTPTTGDLFGAIDRSTYPQLLAGSVIDCSTKTLMEAFTTGIAQVRAMRCKPTHVFINPLDLNRLSATSGIPVQFVSVQGKDAVGKTIEIGAKAVMVSTPGGLVPFVEDPYCPEYAPFVTDINSWTLKSEGDIVFIQQEDGTPVRRAGSSADAWISEIKTRYQLACNKPFASARIMLNSTY